MTAQVDKIRTDFEAAKTAYHQGLDSLKTADGRAVYAPDEAARRSAELRGTYLSAQRDAERAVQDLTNGARDEIAALGVTDPLTRLSSSDVEKAGQLRPFISEDYEKLPVGTLVERAREALQSGDRARRALALRYGRQALATRFSGPGQGYELKGVLAELEETFIDKAKRDALQQTIDAASPLFTSLATQKYLDQAYGHHDPRRRAG